MKTRIKIMSLAFVLISGLLLCKNANAQNDLHKLIEDPYSQALLKVLDAWNKGDLVISKSDVEKDFFVRIDRYDKLQKKDRFVLESYIPIDNIKKRWSGLPKELKRTAPLTLGARMLLLAMMVDKLPQIRNMVPPKPDQLVKAFRASLYIVLASAQQESRVQDSKMVDATAVQRGGIYFLSLGWPFCCAYESRY